MKLLKGAHRSTRKTYSPSGSDPLPTDDQLRSLKEICPDACLFSIIPKLDSDTDTASEDEIEDEFPPLLASLFEEPFSDIQGEELDRYVKTLWMRYHVTGPQIEMLEKQTRGQSICELWHKHREGRITASKVYDVAHRLPSTDPSNLVSKIMGYSSNDLSSIPAVKYGVENEPIARDWYANQMRLVHQDFNCRESGFYIYQPKPFLGASPDGIVSCSCCGRGILEIKWSFKNKEKAIQNAADEDPTFCLDSALSLKANHRYFAQIQLQMYILQVQYCDFVVWTDIEKHRQRISFDSSCSTNLVSASEVLFFNHVLPEIVTRTIYSKRKELDSFDEVWCICRKKAYGKMIVCAGKSCTITKFHYKCVNISRKPRKEWLCQNCLAPQ